VAVRSHGALDGAVLYYDDDIICICTSVVGWLGPCTSNTHPPLVQLKAGFW